MRVTPFRHVVDALRVSVVGFVTLAALAAPLVLPAQAWRTLAISRPAEVAPAPVNASVVFGAGRLTIGPDRAGLMFALNLRYDADRAVPIYAFDADRRTLAVGVRFAEGDSRWRSDRGSQLRVNLPTDTDLALSVEAGAAEGDLDLTGLRLTELTVSIGAADTRLRIDQPNPVRARDVRLDAGAANLEVLHLANARTERVRVNVGVGRVLLDLTGEWDHNMRVDVSAALGKVELVVPKGVGVRIEASSLLQSTDFPGLSKSGNAWVSANWDTAPHQLTVVASGALGRFVFRRHGS
jgi:hypothetical protein